MKNLSIFAKLLVTGLSIAVLTSGIIGIVSILKSSQALKQENFNKVEALSDLKKKTLEDEYLKMISDVESYAQSMEIMDMVKYLAGYHNWLNLSADGNFPIDSADYKSLYNRYFDMINLFKQRKGYNDIYIVCMEHGHVMFSLKKESDFGANLIYGNLKNSHFAHACTSTINQQNTFITDFENYGPIGNKPAQFITSPVYDKNGTMKAVLAVQLTDSIINNTVLSFVGLGETGTSYLVGSDKIMRSNTRFDSDAILNLTDNSLTTEKAIEGLTGVEIEKDYRGVEVISAYNQINIKGLNWIIHTQIDKAEVMKSASQLRNYILIMTVLVILIVIVVYGAQARRMALPIEQAAEFADRVAEGDLTAAITIDQNDEIGKMSRALSLMAERLKEIISSTIQGTDRIVKASSEITGSSHQMSLGANQQASSVEEVSSTMEEIAANIQQNTDNAQQTEQISIRARKGIEEVNENSLKSIEANKQIAEKISVVSDIAFQTNILALNAAVEAARAGEHGKGFAVVAAEVRKLAERSKVAAEEIVAHVNNSLQMAETAGKNMEEILPEVIKTAQLVQEIASASNEQSNGASQVNNAIQQLNSVTQQNASVSDELATNAEEMSNQAEQLKELISFFKVDSNYLKGR